MLFPGVAVLWTNNSSNDEVSGNSDMKFVTTIQTVISPYMCDHLGHMNVQHYARLFGDAAFWIMQAIGIGHGTGAFDHLALVAVRMEVDYLKEIRAGTAVQVASALEVLSERKTSFTHHLHDAEQNVLFAKSKVLSVCIDLETRKSCSLPRPILAVARQFEAGNHIANRNIK